MRGHQENGTWFQGYFDDIHVTSAADAEVFTSRAFDLSKWETFPEFRFSTQNTQAQNGDRPTIIRQSTVEWNFPSKFFKLPLPFLDLIEAKTLFTDFLPVRYKLLGKGTLLLSQLSHTVEGFANKKIPIAYTRTICVAQRVRYNWNEFGMFSANWWETRSSGGRFGIHIGLNAPRIASRRRPKKRSQRRCTLKITFEARD